MVARMQAPLISEHFICHCLLEWLKLSSDWILYSVTMHFDKKIAFLCHAHRHSSLLANDATAVVSQFNRQSMLHRTRLATWEGAWC